MTQVKQKTLILITFLYLLLTTTVPLFAQVGEIDHPDNEFFESVNPLVLQEVDAGLVTMLSTPGGIISRALQFIFPLAMLILFLMLVWGGFEILAKSVSGTKGVEAGKNRITAALVGFLLLFATYWMAQIVEIVFGIVIL